jgi:hypothetical protein
VVNRAIRKIDDQQIRQIQRSPDAEQGRHLWVLNRFIEDSLTDTILRDKKGQPVMETVEGDPNPRPVMISPTPVKVLKALKAMDWNCKIFNLYPPVKRRSRRASHRR